MSRSSASPAMAPGWLAVSRGAALGAGALMLLNTVERRASGAVSAVTWLGDLGPLDAAMIPGLLALGGTALLLFSVKPALPQPVRWSVLLIVAVLMCFLLAGLYRSLTGAAELGRESLLFQPVSWLTTLSIVAVGVLSPGRVLPSPPASMLTVGMVAVLTVTGIMVCTVRSGIHNDPLPGEPTAGAIVVVTDPETVEERVELALEQYSRSPGFVIAVVNHDAAAIETLTKQLGEGAEARALATPRVVPILDANDLDALLPHVADQAAAALDAEDAEPAAADAGSKEDSAGFLIIWCGDATRFARLRRVANRRRLLVVCRATAPELGLASESQRLALETFSLARDMVNSLRR